MLTNRAIESKMQGYVVLAEDGGAVQAAGWLGAAGLPAVAAGVQAGAAMLVDAAIVIESFAVALLFRFNGNVEPPFWSTFWPFAIFASLAFVLLLNERGLPEHPALHRHLPGRPGGQRDRHSRRWALYSDLRLGTRGYRLAHLQSRPALGDSRRGGLAYLQLVAVRLYPRVFYELSLREIGRRTRAAIVGTEESGVALAQHIWRTAAMETQVVGFISDSRGEVGRHIEGAPVLGVVEDLGSSSSTTVWTR